MRILKHYAHGLRRYGYARYLVCRHRQHNVHRISSKIRHHSLLHPHTQQGARYMYRQQVKWLIWKYHVHDSPTHR
nr:MAG TPA: hypothetical protein [Caudoviricetes sp.]